MSTHLRSDQSDHIQRWSGLHVTTFFYQCVCTCVLGHKEGPATQLISSVKKEEENKEDKNEEEGGGGQATTTA